MPLVFLGSGYIGVSGGEQVSREKPAVAFLKEADMVRAMARGVNYLKVKMLGANAIADFLCLCRDRVSPDLLLVGIKRSWLIDSVYGQGMSQKLGSVSLFEQCIG